MEKIIFKMMEGENVTPDERDEVLVNLKDRIANGERGDDVPILMELFGCEYDAACDAVCSGDKGLVMATLNAALAHASTPEHRRDDSTSFDM